MKVTPRQVVGVVSDSTGLKPDEIALLVAGAVALASTIAFLKAVDLISKYVAPARGR